MAIDFIIFGKTPPPIGGVRIHVKRLVCSLQEADYNFSFVSLNPRALAKSYKILLAAKFIHVHTSNVYVRFSFALLCKILKTKLITTYHGNLKRFSPIPNLIDTISLKMTNCPIVLNEYSLGIAKKINRRASLIPAFIPPGNHEIQKPLPKSISNKLENFDYKNCFCTNAYAVNFDKNGCEIYGIIDLVTIFQKHNQLGLIISDPSGAYKKYFSQNKIQLSENILIIAEPHSFLPILKFSNCFIRATSTDGDSLSIKEALYFDKKVIASDCVSRPTSCITYTANSIDALENAILKISTFENKPVDKRALSGLAELRELYDRLLEH